MGAKRLTCEHDPKCCAECRAERKRARERAWRAANPERVRGRLRVWRAANSEREREKRRARHAANPERKRECDRAWRAANSERERERVRVWRAANPERALEYNRVWRAANPERAREYDHGVRFPDDCTIAGMREAQANRCQICRTEFVKTPNVDHCHDTGWVRGLLCTRCNTGLGSFRDDALLLAAAIRYLNDAAERIASYDSACIEEDDAAE